ncbi:MAG: hypothetical protein O3A25_17025 [Acidobacteria bacterium]|nr:hypothetical protein [Acidobacteriota bacterium]
MCGHVLVPGKSEWQKSAWGPSRPGLGRRREESLAKTALARELRWHLSGGHETPDLGSDGVQAEVLACGQVEDHRLAADLANRTSSLSLTALSNEIVVIDRY